MFRLRQTIRIDISDLSEPIIEDLRRSGLSDEYIMQMGIRDVSKKPEYHDYAIPYFDFKGEPIKFFRVRLLRTPKPRTKYLQPKDSPNYVWIPPNWRDIVTHTDADYIVITEGEKKAASIAQYGIPAVALGGVDSWNTNRYRVPITALSKSDDPNALILNLSQFESDALEDKVAYGLIEIAKFASRTGRRLLIAFDSDVAGLQHSTNGVLNPEVQGSAFNLAIWLSGQGVEDIEHVILPPNGRDKTGIDDFVVRHGIQEFRNLAAQRHSFPVHPEPKRWIRQLLSGRIGRTLAQSAATAIVAGLDGEGRRFTDGADRYYYFDASTKVLHTFSLSSNDLKNFRLGSFGTFLHTKFGIGTSDAGLLARIADSFVATRGLEYTTPKRVVYASDDALYYQLSDSRMARVTSERITVVDNGTDGVLFLSGQVTPIDTRLAYPDWDQPGWMRILEKTNLVPMERMTLRQTRILLCCLFYLSPWFRRWRGLMLPVELAIAEPNSGKSFLYNLRRAILTGSPTLQHAPQTIRDWYSDLASTPAMWVGDNLGRLSSSLRNLMSDELARLTTDPTPSVSMRTLYTTAENTRLPVDCTFAMTAINNPFTKEDIMQRSIVIKMEAVPAGMRDGAWYQKEVGGDSRGAWIAEHLVVAKRFLLRAAGKWDPGYLSKHRLVHLEQALVIMGEVLGYGDEIEEAVSTFTDSVQENIAQFNPVIEALRGFVKDMDDRNALHHTFQASDIASWGHGNFDFGHVRVIQETRSLARYITAHAYDIKQSTGIYRTDTRVDGRYLYAVDPDKAAAFLE